MDFICFCAIITIMIYPYMTLPDETEITHSEIIRDGGRERVKVFIETPIEGGFKDAVCVLPDYKWENHGYTDEEMKYYKDFVEKAAHLFFKFARGGGFENAAALYRYCRFAYSKHTKPLLYPARSQPELLMLFFTLLSFSFFWVVFGCIS